jgi:hypothetical protein
VVQVALLVQVDLLVRQDLPVQPDLPVHLVQEDPVEHLALTEHLDPVVLLVQRDHLVHLD